MKKIFHFLQYHNAVPVALGFMFLGATGVFAATNPEAIYSAEEHVLSVDNTYIAEKNLDSWTPRVEILGVTEDIEDYYVAYRFSTIDNKEYVWQDVVKEETMTVSKADLGQYRDLGVYVTAQLKQKIERELARLKETQEIEKKQISRKMVATAYGGIVGKFLDDTTETLPGYSPVVTPPAEPPTVFTEALPPPPDVVIPDEEPVAKPPPQTETPPESAASTPPMSLSTGLTIQILGENPARVPVGGSYTDLGAVATNDANEEIAVTVYMNGEPVEHVAIDTATTSMWTIRYEATDADGTVSATRTVEIYDPAAEAPAPEPQPEAASSTPPAAAEPEPAPVSPPAEEPPPVEEQPATQESAPEAPAPPPEAQPEPAPAEPVAEPAP